jgi:hypothetical protein
MATTEAAKVTAIRAVPTAGAALSKRRERTEVDRAEIAEWIQEWRRTSYEEAADPEDPETAGGALRTIVIRRQSDRRQRPLLMIPISDDMATSDLVQRVTRVAERYAGNAAPGAHCSLEVAAFYGSEQIPRAVETIGLRAPDEDEDDLDAGGAWTGGRGDAVRAVVTHAGIVTQIADRKDARATRVLQDALESAYRRVRELEEDNARLFEVNLKLADTAAEREVKVIAAKNSAELKREAGKTALALAPAAINRIAGKQILPEGVHPLLAQLSNLTADLADEKLQEALFATLLRHGQKGARILQGIGELMAQTATINAAADSLAKGADTARDMAAKASAAEPSTSAAHDGSSSSPSSSSSSSPSSSSSSSSSSPWGPWL